jgi:hypothetical protein
MSKLVYDENTKYLNQLFVDAVHAGDRVKCAQAGELYIRERMREAPFCRKILPPIPITKEDCQRSTEHDTLTIIKDIAPEAEAVSMTFRGRPNHKYIQGKRFEIGLYKISSPMYTKSEAELLAYEMPITALIEEDIVKMMQKEEDSNFMAQCRDVVARSGKSLNVTTPTHKITRESLTALTNMIDGDELETACFLMSKTTWNEWAAQGNEVFDIGAWDVVRHGYKEEEILGRKCFVTLKEDLIPNNEIWAFCSPEYLGYMFTLDDAKFWVDSRADEIFFKGWEFIGCGFGNIRGMAMITIS